MVQSFNACCRYNYYPRTFWLVFHIFLYTFNSRLVDKLMGGDDLNDEDLVQLIKDTKDAASVEESKQSKVSTKEGKHKNLP